MRCASANTGCEPVFRKKAVIGQGRFGTVFRCVLGTGDHAVTVAMKETALGALGWSVHSARSRSRRLRGLRLDGTPSAPSIVPLHRRHGEDLHCTRASGTERDGEAAARREALLLQRLQDCGKSSDGDGVGDVAGARVIVENATCVDKAYAWNRACPVNGVLDAADGSCGSSHVVRLLYASPGVNDDTGILPVDSLSTSAASSSSGDPLGNATRACGGSVGVPVWRTFLELAPLGSLRRCVAMSTVRLASPPHIHIIAWACA